MDNQTSSDLPVPLASPPVEKSKDLFKILLIVVGFLIILGLFGNIYLLLRKENQKPISEITPTPTQTSFFLTPTIDPTANWKTYTSTKYGYSIQYPLEAEVNEVGYPNKDMCLNFKYKLTSITIVAPDAGGAGCIRTGFGYEIKEKEERLIIVGKEYLVRTTEEIGPGETLNYHNETSIVKGSVEGPKGKLGLEFGSVSDEKSTYQEYLENKEYIYQILSTFKFLE